MLATSPVAGETEAPAHGDSKMLSGNSGRGGETGRDWAELGGSTTSSDGPRSEVHPESPLAVP